jgi:hypothetical protein
MLGGKRRRLPIDAVGTEHGVQMHDATPLELRHPAEGQTDTFLRFSLSPPEGTGQVAQHIDRGPAPQFGGAGILQHGALEVVAFRAERSTDHGVAVIVLLRTSELASVHAPE